MGLQDPRRAFTRRQFLGYLGAGGAALGLAACGGSSGGSGSPHLTNGSSAQLPSWLQSEAKQYRGRSLNVVASQQYFATTNQDFVNACQTFGKLTGTNVTVAVINVDTGNIVSREDSAVKSGNGPDIGFVDASRFAAEYYQLGDLQPVTDVVNELSSRYGPPPDVNKILLQYGPNKDWYGIPYFSITNGWFVRKDWLQEKGIKDSEFKTLQQARDVALEISDPSQQRYGWGMTFNNGGDGTNTIGTVLNAWGAAVASNDGTKVVFGNGPETTDAVTFLADLYSNPKYKPMLPPGVLSWTDTSNNQAWLAGIIGLTTNAFSLYAQSKADNNPVYGKTRIFDGFTGPAIKQPILIPASQAFVLFKGAREPGLAKLLAKYLVYGAPLLQMVKDSVGLVLPAYQNIWTSNSYYLHGDPSFGALHTEMSEPLPVKTTTGLAFPQTPSPGSQAVNSSYPLNDMLASIVSKKATIKEAIATAKQRIIQIFEQQGLPQ